MLIQLEDVARTSTNTKQRFLGIVVDNVDPDGLGRIKAKVPNMLETADETRLPWVYPYRSADTGGNPANSSHKVPQINSQVYITFPNGDPYSAYYEAAPLNKGTVQDPSHENPVPEAPSDELRNQVEPSASNSSNIDTYGWRTTRGHVNWLRIDRNQGKVELYMGEAELFFHFDRGGNVQLKTPGNLDFDIGGKITFKSGQDFTMQVGRQCTIDAAKDLTFKTAEKYLLDVGADASTKVTGNRGAMVGGDDDTAISGSRRSLVTGTDAVKAQKLYHSIDTTVTLKAGSTYNLKVGGTASISADSLLQLGAPTILKNSGGGASSATAAAVAAMEAYFIAAAAGGSNMSAAAMVDSLTLGSYFPIGTNPNLPLSQQPQAIKGSIESTIQSVIYQGRNISYMFKNPIATVISGTPLQAFAHCRNVKEFIQVIPTDAFLTHVSAQLFNGINPQLLFKGDIKGLLASMTPNQLIGLTNLGSVFQNLDPQTLINSMSTSLLNGFSLQGLTFNFIGKKIMSDFMNKFAAHLTALASLLGRVQLMDSKLNVLGSQGTAVQQKAQQFDQTMAQRAARLVGQDF